MRLALEPGSNTIGRSRSCQLVLDDALVSRQHARLVVTGETVTIEDLGSRNCVYVNARALQRVQELAEGDQVQVGAREFVVKSETLFCRRESQPTRDTLVPDLVLQTSEPPVGESSSKDDEPATLNAYALDMLGGAADKAMALGQVNEAEKMLGVILNGLLAKVRADRGRSMPSHVYDKAAHYAVRLAEGTGSGKWVDYAVQLFSRLGRPLPAPVVDDLYHITRKISAIDLAEFRSYLDLLKQRQKEFSVAERFALQRLEGFESIAALR